MGYAVRELFDGGILLVAVCVDVGADGMALRLLIKGDLHIINGSDGCLHQGRGGPLQPRRRLIQLENHAERFLRDQRVHEIDFVNVHRLTAPVAALPVSKVEVFAVTAQPVAFFDHDLLLLRLRLEGRGFQVRPSGSRQGLLRVQRLVRRALESRWRPGVHLLLMLLELGVESGRLRLVCAQLKLLVLLQVAADASLVRFSHEISVFGLGPGLFAGEERGRALLVLRVQAGQEGRYLVLEAFDLVQHEFLQILLVLLELLDRGLFIDLVVLRAFLVATLRTL